MTRNREIYTYYVNLLLKLIHSSTHNISCCCLSISLQLGSYFIISKVTYINHSVLNCSMAILIFSLYKITFEIFARHFIDLWHLDLIISCHPHRYLDSEDWELSEHNLNLWHKKKEKERHTYFSDSYLIFQGSFYFFSMRLGRDSTRNGSTQYIRVWIFSVLER